MQCQNNDAGDAVIHTLVTLPPPPPSISPFTKTTEGSTANAGDLILFRMDYTYVNQTSPVTITDTMPPNVTLAGVGSNISPNGTYSAPNFTWILPASVPTTSGYVWFLGQVSAGVTTGQIISNQAAASSSANSVTSNVANVSIGARFQLSKSQSATTLNAGDTMTYTLNYSLGGYSLQTSDAYLNDTSGTSTTDGSNITGYNGVTYIASNAGTGCTNNWKMQTDAQGNHYIDFNTPIGNWGGNSCHYETLLRSGPSNSNLCNGSFIVEGDALIPSKLSDGTGNGTGEDASLAVAIDQTTHYGFVLILSADNNPSYFTLQASGGAPLGLYNVSGATQKVTSFAGFQSTTMKTTGVLFDTWYTMKALVSYNAGSGTYTVNARVWPVGTLEPTTWDITYSVATSGELPCNSGTYLYGFQGNPTSAAGPVYSSGRQEYTNLRYFGADPAVNVRITDAAPAEITYTNANIPPTSMGPPIKWQFAPVTIYDQTGAITWWGVASCAAGSGITNVSIINDDLSSAPVTSNAVTASISCFTNTPTYTPTNTPTATPTFTPTNSPTPSPTYTPTNSPTQSPTPTTTYTPTYSPTVTSTYTPTVSPTYTDTVTPTVSPTYTNTVTSTVSPTFTFTVTDTVTPTNTLTATPTETPQFTYTQTYTFTPTNSPTVTNTVTATVSPTCTNTVTNTKTPTSTYTVTNTPSMTNTPAPTPTDTATTTPTMTPTAFVLVNLNKTVSDTAPSSDEALVFTLKANVPFSDATSVTITDTIPAGLTYVSAPQPSNPPGGSLTVIPLSTPPPTGGTGTLLVWVFPTMPSGNYNFTYNATVNDFMPGGTAITNCAAWTYPQVPLPQEACAALTVQGNFTVRIGVYNEAGELVDQLMAPKRFSELIQNVNMSLNTLVSINDVDQISFHGVVLGAWNGTTTGGSEVTNGKYYIKVDNIDPSGVVNTQTQAVLVARHLATVTVNIYNGAGEVVKHLTETMADALPMNTGFSLSTSTFAPGYQGGSNSNLQIGLSGGITVTWDGRGDNGEFLTNGQYSVEVTTVDGQGGNATVTKQVTIYHSGLELPNGYVSVFPNPYSAKTNANSLVTIKVGGNYSLKASIYTVAGELVDQVASLPGNNFTTWDPTAQTASGSYSVASGVYIAVVVISDPQGATQRTTHKIVVIH